MYIPTYTTGKGMRQHWEPPQASDAFVEPYRRISGEDITVVIPTFGRDYELLDTIHHIIELKPRPRALLVIDQTPRHAPEIEAELTTLALGGTIAWIHLDHPSQAAAMNHGLLEAATDYVLFHDDDIIPHPSIIEELVGVINEVRLIIPECMGIAGQVIQPKQTEIPFDQRRHSSSFPFNSDRRCFVDSAPAGNFCVHRRMALRLGGFDESFVGAANQCDTEFVMRIMRAGGLVLYEPKVSVCHLQAPSGGVRSYGDVLCTWRPHHAVGYYYCALRGEPGQALRRLLWRPWRSSSTRFHLRHPWYIPVTLVSNYLGVGWALWFRAFKQRLIPEDVARAALYFGEREGVGSEYRC